MTVVDAIAEVIDARDKAQAEEFRRLAAEAKERGLQAEGNYQLQRGKRLAFEQAAQMLEERLNG